MPARARPVAVHEPADDPVMQLLGQVAGDITDMKTDHAVMKAALGKPSEDGKGGTGVVGDVIQLKRQVNRAMILGALAAGILLAADKGLLGLLAQLLAAV